MGVTREEEWRRGRKGEGREKRMLSTFYSDQSNKRVIYKAVSAAFLISFFSVLNVHSCLHAHYSAKVSLNAYICLCVVHSVRKCKFNYQTIFIPLQDTSWTGSRCCTPSSRRFTWRAVLTRLISTFLLAVLLLPKVVHSTQCLPSFQSRL